MAENRTRGTFVLRTDRGGENVAPQQFCCDAMADAWDDFVGYSDWAGMGSYLGAESKPPPRAAVNLAQHLIYHDESYDVEYRAIRFCPWCAAPLPALDEP